MAPIEEVKIMRTLFWGFVVVSVAVVTYCTWALLGAAQLAVAARGGDTAATMAQVDLPLLRHSLARQIVRAYMRQNEKLKRMSGLAQSLAGGVGTSVADSILEDILTPENITKMLKDGRMGTAKINLGGNAPLPKLDGISLQNVATVLNTYFDSPTSFAVPLSQGGAEYAVHMALEGTTWKLSGIDLPSALVDRLAKEVTARQKQSSLSGTSL